MAGMPNDATICNVTAKFKPSGDWPGLFQSKRILYLYVGNAMCATITLCSVIQMC